MEQEDLANMLFNLHDFVLSSLKHIKKYKKIRKLESEVVSKMVEYMFSENYHIEEVLDTVFAYEYDRNPDDDLSEFELVDSDEDFKVLCELCLYQNHPLLKSITDIFIENKKFRNEDKIKMLKSIRDSFVGLFEVINVDTNQGFVYIKDILTGKEFKMVDIKLSAFPLDNINKQYYYNRIITYEDISFWTGLKCPISINNKKLKKFLKDYKRKKCSDFMRCIKLYEISKNENRL